DHRALAHLAVAREAHHETASGDKELSHSSAERRYSTDADHLVVTPQTGTLCRRTRLHTLDHRHSVADFGAHTAPGDLRVEPDIPLRSRTDTTHTARLHRTHHRVEIACVRPEL